MSSNRQMVFGYLATFYNHKITQIFTRKNLVKSRGFLLYLYMMYKFYYLFRTRIYADLHGSIFFALTRYSVLYRQIHIRMKGY